MMPMSLPNCTGVLSLDMGKGKNPIGKPATFKRKGRQTNPPASKKARTNDPPGPAVPLLQVDALG